MDKNRYFEEDFVSFVQELLDRKCFNDSKEEGIAKLVIDKGFESLSDKQKFVFENSISDLVYDECRLCGEDIPWCEMSAAEDNGQLCSWCYHVRTKDD